MTFHPSPNIIRVTKSGRMGWARHVACVGREETRKQSAHLVDIGADGSIVLESYLKQSFGMT